MLRPGDKMPEKEDNVDFAIPDLSDYDPPHVPSKTWREFIKKVWEFDPLTCPRCGFRIRLSARPLSFFVSFFSLRALVLFSCHLTGIAHSGEDSKFGQDVHLQQIPYTYKSNDNQNFFHFLPLIHMSLKGGSVVIFGHQTGRRHH